MAQGGRRLRPVVSAAHVLMVTSPPAAGGGRVDPEVLVPAATAWLAPVVIREFHLGMVERLADVMRRRETLVGQSPPPPSSSAWLSARNPEQAIASRVLTVADLRAAEQAPPPSRQPRVVRDTNAFRASQKEASLGLAKWIKTHRFLKAVNLSQGEPTIALLILWEIDHACEYPSLAVELVGRVATLTRRLNEAVAADTELSSWMTSKCTRIQLSPGLAPTAHQRWAIKIDPAVGEPFLGKWKEHLLSLVQHQQVVTVDDQGPARKRLKREIQPRNRGAKRERDGGAPPPPLTSKKARVERLKAAQAARESVGSPSVVSSSSSMMVDAGGSQPSEVASRAGTALPGAIT